MTEFKTCCGKETKRLKRELSRTKGEWHTLARCTICNRTERVPASAEEIKEREDFLSGKSKTLFCNEEAK